MNTELKKMVEKINPLPYGLFQDIISNSMTTGSLTFGGHTKTSDIDILVLESKILPFLDSKTHDLWAYLYVNKLGVYDPTHKYNFEGDCFKSIYCKTEQFYYQDTLYRNAILNLIIFTKEGEDNFLVWCGATKMLRGLSTLPQYHKLLQNKGERVALFENAKEMLRRV